MFRLTILKFATRISQLHALPQQYIAVAAISSSSKMSICNKSVELNPKPIFNGQSVNKVFVPPVAQLRAVAFSTEKTEKTSTPPGYSARQAETATSTYISADPKKPSTLEECEAALAASGGAGKSDYKIEISKAGGKSGGGGGGGSSASGGGSTGGGGSGSGTVVPTMQFPSKEQLEKYFFRVVAFIYDLTFFTLNWTAKNLEEHVAKNEKVQEYWKKFHDKMQQAKRD